MATELTSDNFKPEVLESDIPVLADFWATWCGPCMMMAPIVDQLATELEGKVKVVKVDVDKAQDLAQQYGITSIPTLILFKNGEVAKKHVGSMPAPKLKEFAES